MALPAGAVEHTQEILFVTVQPLDVKKYYAAIGISLFFCSVSKDGVGRL